MASNMYNAGREYIEALILRDTRIPLVTFAGFSDTSNRAFEKKLEEAIERYRISNNRAPEHIYFNPGNVPEGFTFKAQEGFTIYLSRDVPLNTILFLPPNKPKQ